MGDNSFLHLARPLAPAAVSNAPPSTAPVIVSVQPQAIFSILDHASRRPVDQERVIGTLLGVRSEDGSEVEIRNCYAVPHTETAEQVEVDMDYQKRMLELHLKANPREVLIGWYATSSELNTFSALIQNFYSQQGEGTFPHPAVHLTVNTIAGQDVKADTYISAPIGVTAERAADSCLFIPVPHEIKYGDAERSGLELIAGAREREDRTQLLQTDIETLERAIEQVLEMLERVSNYVSDVLDEEAKPSSALGQFLMNTLSLAPKVSSEDIEKDLYVQVPLLRQYAVTNSIPATTTSRTSFSSPTSQTRSAPKSTSPTVSRPPPSPWERAHQPRTTRTKTKTKTEKLAREVASARNSRNGLVRRLVSCGLRRVIGVLHHWSKERLCVLTG
jgi:translation initiation factor 3 subunit F